MLSERTVNVVETKKERTAQRELRDFEIEIILAIMTPY